MNSDRSRESPMAGYSRWLEEVKQKHRPTKERINSDLQHLIRIDSRLARYGPGLLTTWRSNWPPYALMFTGLAVGACLGWAITSLFPMTDPTHTGWAPITGMLVGAVALPLTVASIRVRKRVSLAQAKHRVVTEVESMQETIEESSAFELGDMYLATATPRLPYTLDTRQYEGRSVTLPAGRLGLVRDVFPPGRRLIVKIPTTWFAINPSLTVEQVYTINPD